MPDSSCHLFIC